MTTIEPMARYRELIRAQLLGRRRGTLSKADDRAIAEELETMWWDMTPDQLIELDAWMRGFREGMEGSDERYTDCAV